MQSEKPPKAEEPAEETVLSGLLGRNPNTPPAERLGIKDLSLLNTIKEIEIEIERVKGLLRLGDITLPTYHKKLDKYWNALKEMATGETIEGDTHLLVSYLQSLQEKRMLLYGNKRSK